MLTAILIAAKPASLSPPLDVEEIAPGIFVHQGAHEEATVANLGGYANIGFIVGERAVAVIDSGGSAAQGARLRTAISSVTALPVKYVILTHVHPDHMLGSAAFSADQPVFVGHQSLPRAMAARGRFYLEGLRRIIGETADGTRLIPPSLLVRGGLELDLGRRRLRLTAHRAGHTDNDLTVYDVASRTLWASDLLFVDRIPIIDGSLIGWLSVMEELAKVPAARAVPGHGPVSVTWPGALAAQRRYLTVLRDEIRALISEGGTMETAVAQIGSSEREAWLLYNAYHARNVVTAFAELEWE